MLTCFVGTSTSSLNEAVNSSVLETAATNSLNVLLLVSPSSDLVSANTSSVPLELTYDSETSIAVSNEDNDDDDDDDYDDDDNDDHDDDDNDGDVHSDDVNDGDYDIDDDNSDDDDNHDDDDVDNDNDI